MAEIDVAWSEGDSEEFIEYGHFFVPQREKQADVVAAMAGVDGPDARILDLCCGQGLLSRALLRACPEARVVGMDASPTMLDRAREDLSEFGGRFTTERFDLAATEWRDRATAPSAVVSSLALHHLDGEEKKALYRDLRRMLAPGGRLVIADIVQPVSERGVELAKRSWEDAVRERSLAEGGDLAAYRKFHELKWSNFHYPDPMDKPSTLPDHLAWLTEAGFSEVDVYWMDAGHAVYGGVAP
ncbi:class I SAM-dependent methyltransferase [Salininema proteolyticum]|uniref:Class I SAM-dependent methyltransferase n=1 Tax=Salininema proteolyticum TaxID=1607685 RepID=A0ABV8TZT9_9ACTN